ncbi:MAG: carbohydrate-binding family 9-like protein [Thermoguttaceae bacterium]|jgi:hypothetical protein
MKHFLAVLLTLMACPLWSVVAAETPIITAASSAADPLVIPYIDASANIDAMGEDEVWNKIAPLTSFRYYWDPEEPPKTELRLFHDGTHLYFLYTVEDDEVITHPVINEEMDIASEDRIELGFSSEDASAPYYFFEIDPVGRVLDYEGRFYRKFNPGWDSRSLEVLGRLTEIGYEVEGKFELAELRELGVLRPDGKMRVGFFRGEYFSGSSEDDNHKWISWIYSGSAQPDFHLHSAFGTARIETR